MKLNIEKMDKDKLKDIIDYYKKVEKKNLLDKFYKVEAIVTFQKNWDINSNNFFDMMSNSLSKTKNLLASKNYFPKNMILYFAKKEPETVRDMFINLFNETILLSRRISYFKDRADILLKQYGNINMKSHYQQLSSITTYLFLRFPEKYCIYKESMFRNFAKKIGYKDFPKRGSLDALEMYYELCDYIFNFIKDDSELLELIKKKFFNLEFADKGMHIVTDDIIYIGNKIDLNYNKKINKANKNKSGLMDKKQMRSIDKDKSGLMVDSQTNFIDNSEKDDLKNLNIKTLTDITFVDNTYTKEDFLNEVFIDEKDYDCLIRLLNRKKNIILQGAPGVGKTFLSKRLAYSILNEKSKEKIKFVQFHQSYSYEDFILGYKPSKNGFKLEYGIFYNFCKKAQSDPNNKYFFIIDEINRGNISQIFGELMMAIENEYRGLDINLAYGNMTFNVPKNIYLIGIMNTSDRSIAMVDYALRRRFSFFEVKPAFENDKFKKYIEALKNKKIDSLVKKIKFLNKDIKEDFSLGDGFCIGHSYLLEKELLKNEDDVDDYIMEIVEFEIIPLLREYWFDNEDKLSKWEKILRNL